MTWSGAATILLCSVGGGFFLAGTVGLLRFPDTCTRLHAITKADNLGLGFIVAGLGLQAESSTAVAKLIVVWLLAMLGSASACFLLGRWTLSQPRKSHGGRDSV